MLPLFVVAQTNYQQAEEYYKQKDFKKAKPIFESYLKQHPKDRKTQEYLGDIAANEKDWDAAIDSYKRLVQEDDTNANYHFKYGGALGMKAMSVSRIRALTYIGTIKRQLERAAELDPKHIEARWALIELYVELPGILGGNNSKAKHYAGQLAAISPVDGYLAKGYIAEYTNRPKDAERYYKKAIKVDSSFRTFKKLSALNKKNNQPKRTISTASKPHRLHKRNQLNYMMGKVCAQYNIDPQYGIDCLGEYIANYTIMDGAPKKWAYYRLAQIYKNLGKKELALTWINEALAEHDDFKEAQKEKSIILAL